MLSEETSADEFEHSSSHGDAEMTDRPGFNLRDRHRARKLYFENIRKQRTAIQNMTKPLKLWLCRNKAHPYPTKSDKSLLAKHANMTMTQVNNWFANARRRLKNTVRYPDMAWDQRIRLYNSHVTGNAELLSITSQEELCNKEATSCHKERSNVEKMKTDDQPPHSELDCSPSPRLHEEPEGLLSSGSMKYKNAIIQRYLNDTLKYGKLSCHYPEPAEPSNHMSSRYIKHRQMSGSSMEDTTCSEDCMSPDPVSPCDRYHLSNNNLPHNNSASNWAEELSKLQALVSGTEPRHPRISLSYSDLNANELSAVMALTDLALGKS